VSVVSVGGYELNADLNAAYNIRNIHQASLGMFTPGGSQSSDLSYPLTRLPVSEVQAVRRKKTVVDCVSVVMRLAK
jgi:transposase